MSDAAEIAITNEPPLQATKRQKYSALFKQFWSLVAPYWKSEEKVFAWLMLATVFALSMAGIYFSVLLNKWSASFYNALQVLDKGAFNSLLMQFFWLVLCMIVMFVAEAYSRTYLAFRWRMWFTKQLMKDWLHDNTFSRLFTHGAKTENPDQRISQDVSLFTSSTLSLSLSMISSLIKSATFAVILWTLSSSILLPLPGGVKLDIPGYMLWFTIIYVTISTIAIFKTGKPLVKLDYTQEKVEADFRFSLMRIRDRRDEVALLNGAKAENRFLAHNLLEIIRNYKQILLRNIYVNSLQNLFLNFSTVLPILAAAPMFFAGTITLGVLMQIGSAFGEVQGALMIFALNFQSFASWKATFNRIVDFKHEMQQLKSKQHASHPNLAITVSDDSLNISNLILQLPDASKLTSFNLNVQPHERVLIMGRSGLGKTTLFKCIAGQWPYASGTIVRPEHLTVMPQKPYFPIAPLRDCLLYPELDRDVSDQEMQRVLEICSLDVLKDKLNVTQDWVATLSLGEQQRLNFARTMLAKPKWILLDEPTASMDKSLEAHIFNVFLKELPDITLVTIGHAPTLKDLHTRTVEF